MDGFAGKIGTLLSATRLFEVVAATDICRANDNLVSITV